MASRMLRLLGVLTVVAGVFAMHGLTSHHDVAMAGAEAPMVHALPAPHLDPVGELHVIPGGDMHDMGGACLAVLTGLVLLLALLLGLRSLLVWRAVRMPSVVRRWVLGERSPPRSVPLSSLGVLRI